MIRYTVVCVKDHAFESWFRDSTAFDTLAGQGQIPCPTCGSTAVRKALMTPSVVTSRTKAAATPAAAASPTAPAAVPSQPPSPPILDERAQQARAALRDLRRKIMATSEDVGRSFAVEARAIHDGEAPARAIYGEATRDEVSALIEDEIPLLPMPMLPDEHH